MLLFTLILLSLVLGLLVLPAPAHAATISPDCAAMSVPVWFSSPIGPFGALPTASLARNFYTGEIINISASSGNPTRSVTITVNAAVVASGTGTAAGSYTIPADGAYTITASEFVPPMAAAAGVTASAGCTAVSDPVAPGPVNVGNPSGANLPAPEPFFQNSDPALGVNLELARQTPDEFGVLPIDVFEPHWWGVKSLTAARFPKLAGMDLTTVEVRCLNSTGQWTTDHVSVWSSSPTQLQVYVRQHGFCGIFPK